MRWDKQTTKDLRQGAESRGRWAEDEAAKYLVRQGFKDIARRAKTPVGEIDLIVEKKDLLCFVEVKYREQVEDALWSILPRQQTRIAHAAQTWLASNQKYATFSMRFDAIIVNAQGVASHIEDAFRPDF